MSEKQPTRNQLEIMIDLAAQQLAIEKETIASLTTSRNALEKDNKKLRDIVIDFNDAFEHCVFGVLPNGNEACGYDEGRVRGGELLNRLHDRSLPFLMESEK